MLPKLYSGQSAAESVLIAVKLIAVISLRHCLEMKDLCFVWTYQLDRSIDITNPSLFRYAVLSCYIYVLELENISKDLGFTKLFNEMCIIECVLLRAFCTFSITDFNHKMVTFPVFCC